MKLRNIITVSAMILVLLLMYSLAWYMDKDEEKAAQRVNPASPLYSLSCPVADQTICEAMLRKEYERARKRQRIEKER